MSTLQINVHNKFAIISLNSPPVNALSMQVWQDLLSALNDIESDSRMQGLIITSALSKPLFTAGNDLTSLYVPATTQAKFRKFWLTQTEFLTRLYKSRLVTIACINGHSPAGGCGISLCCDVRIMADSASTGNFAHIGLNEVAIGILVPKYWNRLFIATIGSHGRAEKYTSFGKMLTPEEALKVGLVDQVVPRNEVLPAGIKLMSELVKIDGNGRSVTKKLVREDFANEWMAYGEDEAKEAWTMLSSDHVVKALGATLKRLNKSKI